MGPRKDRAGLAEGPVKMALVLEYDGTRYHGFQYQINAPSVQAEMEEAIYRFTGERVRIKAAGRTDAGVHATGQVVAFFSQAGHQQSVWLKGLNAHLPEDIAVQAAYRVNADFDPRRHAVSRTYRYTIFNRQTRSPLWRRFSHHIPWPLEVSAMAEAFSLLEGRRDFAPFSGPLGPRRTSVRRIFRTEVEYKDGIVALEVEGDAFLPQQVRRMAWTLVKVGRGQMALAQFQELANRGGLGAANGVLPAKGLCLVNVKYREFPPKQCAQEEIQHTYRNWAS